MRAFLPFIALLLVAPASCDRKAPSGGVAAASGSASAVPSDVKLPTSRSTVPVPTDPLVVVLSPTRVAVDRDGPTLAVPDPATWDKGLDAKYKTSSRNDYRVLPLETALAARRVGDAGLPVVAIDADASLSYRSLFEALYTIGQNGGDRIALVVRNGGALGAIDLAVPHPEARLGQLGQLPRDGSRPPTDPGSRFALHVMVTADGFLVTAAGLRIATGCNEPGEGVAVPKHDGAFDYAALTACAARLKATSPDFAGETKVTVGAAGGIDTQTAVSAIDALRGSDAPLFPNVELGVPN
jgi:biopolymer transport protein ExbD